MDEIGSTKNNEGAIKDPRVINRDRWLAFVHNNNNNNNKKTLSLFALFGPLPTLVSIIGRRRCRESKQKKVPAAGKPITAITSSPSSWRRKRWKPSRQRPKVCLSWFVVVCRGCRGCRGCCCCCCLFVVKSSESWLYYACGLCLSLSLYYLYYRAGCQVVL
jgi:hypothetical protein